MQRMISKVKKLQTYKIGDDKLVELDEVIKIIEEYKMTLKEVRAAADTLGYMAVKQNYTKLIPCICGCDKRRRIQKNGSYYIECKKCVRYSVGKNVYQAVDNWNEMMTKPKKIISDEHKRHLSESAKAYWDKKKEEENNGTE